jgi:hypothetical protein
VENTQKHSNYLCKCACGTICEVLGKDLNRASKNKGGGKKSCGCLRIKQMELFTIYINDLNSYKKLLFSKYLHALNSCEKADL